jgi:hypothetical protein
MECHEIPTSNSELLKADVKRTHRYGRNNDIFTSFYTEVLKKLIEYLKTSQQYKIATFELNLCGLRIRVFLVRKLERECKSHRETDKCCNQENPFTDTSNCTFTIVLCCIRLVGLL